MLHVARVGGAPRGRADLTSVRLHLPNPLSLRAWCHLIIGGRERANLVVRSSGILYVRSRSVRTAYRPRACRTSCKCACAALYGLLFYFCTFSHAVPRQRLLHSIPLPNLHGSKLQLTNTLGLLVHILLPGGPANTRRVVGQPDRSLPSLVDHDRRAESVR